MAGRRAAGGWVKFKDFARRVDLQHDGGAVVVGTGRCQTGLLLERVRFDQIGKR